MRTTELSAAYDRLLAAARTITPDTPLDPEQRADTDWTLCHVALSDRILGDAAYRVLHQAEHADGDLVVDNFPAMDPAAIAEMTASTTHADRVLAVEQHAAALIAMLAETSQESARAPLTLRMNDRTGRHIGDTEMTWESLVTLRSSQHIPAHADRLRGYVEHRVP